MADWFASFVRALHVPAEEILDPSRRLYWPFFACSAALALLVFLARGVSMRRALRALASPSLWFHRSARGDYKLIAARAALKAFLLGSFGLSLLAVATLTARWLRVNVGASSLHGTSPWVVGAAFTLTAFLAEDASRYLVHRVMHRVPLLWEFHKVHHAAEVLTPFTLYRTHPVEALINGARGALSVGLVTGLFAWAFGPALHAWEVLGVDAIGFVWTLFGANLRHSHVWLSYGPRVERFFMSPAQHQVHHSDAPRHFDKNFGTILGVWDWLGGSLYVTRSEREALRFGLPAGEREHRAHGLYAMLVAPFVNAARRVLTGLAALLAPGRFARVGRAGIVLVACLALTASTCTPARRANRAQIVEAMGRCTLDSATRFHTVADALVAATSSHAAAPTEASRAAARAAWEAAIDVWEQNEMLRYGPAAGFDSLGGMGIRENIYSWPDVNRCLIEQQIVARSYENGGLPNLSNSVRGLAAIEYLLFYTGADNACAPADPINMMGTWAALSPDELARRRAAYAHAAAVDVAARSRALTAAWEPNGFLAQLTTAGRGSTLFPTQQRALSAIADAVFHLDTDIKDIRLGTPLGIVNCPAGTTCPTRPEALESRWADRGRQHLRNNLAGLRVLLEGCAAGDTLGFDDLLDGAGLTNVTAQLRVDLQAAEAAIDAMPTGATLSQVLATDPAALRRVHEAIRTLTTFLKNDFTMTLELSGTRVAGDND